MVRFSLPGFLAGLLGLAVYAVALSVLAFVLFFAARRKVHAQGG
jgi:hypothetical protein